MAHNNEICEECEQDVPTVGYYTRSKRRKLNKSDEECSLERKESIDRKRKNPIMFIPLEILTEILRKISFEELGRTVRLVNRRFKNVVENIMNCSFRNLERRLLTLKKTTEISLAYTQDDDEIRNISKLLSMLEMLQLQYNVTFATIWRYVYNEYYKTSMSCMYGGQLIDAYQDFIRALSHSPQRYTASAQLKDYEFPHDVMKIIQMTKLFCLHFDKVNEEPRPECLVDSGCKMVDIIDSARFIEKKTCWEYCSKEYFNAKYIYLFRSSWFIALPIKLTKDLEPSQKQRMMHMRLRRIVLAHNDMFLAHVQYEREMILRPAAQLSLKKPSNNVYTGYGDAGDVFFYYGVMNEGAYIQKFNIEEDTDFEDDDIEEGNIAVQNDGQNLLVRNNSEEYIRYSVSHLGFQVIVDVKCSVAYAPWQYMKKLNSENFQIVKRPKKTKETTKLKMTFDCFGATYPRLPSVYEYDFCPSGF